MNFKKLIVCFVGGLAVCAGVRADDLAMNNSKQDYYTPIITRNVFGLNPLVVETNPVVDASLPKITPNGIMSIFGKSQALFKVTPTGKGAGKEQYYTLSAGERQDDIEVMRIDEENGIITFKNHGTVQELPLAEPSKNGGGSTLSPLPGNPGGFNPSGGNNGENPGGPGNRITRFGQRGGGPGGFNRRGNNQDNNGATSGDGSEGLNLRTIPTRTYQPPASNLTPEETVLRIEENRAKLLDAPADQRPYSPNLLPPTPLTGQY